MTLERQDKGPPLSPAPGEAVALDLGLDTGAYAWSMWSRYNLRDIPKVLGIEGRQGRFEVRVLRERTPVF